MQAHPFEYYVDNGGAVTLASLNVFFPPRPKAVAKTGYIPMGIFEKHEETIRKVVKADRLRVIYRGPRVGKKWGPRSRPGLAAMTLRANAHSAVLYTCSDKAWQDRQKEGQY
jgi:hypothetical protein